MGFDPFTAIFDLGKTILEKWIPDANKREEVALHLATQANALMMAQIDVNKAEATHTNVFVSGWRPFVGWVCASAFAYKFVLQPFMVFGFVVLGVDIPLDKLPVLDWTELSGVLFGILGLGALRTYEKKEGIASK